MERVNIYLHEYPKFHDMTLAEVAEATDRRQDGWAVFLTEPDDYLGNLVGEDFSVADIIRQHPEIKNWVVKYTNNYMGMIVLRAAPPAEGKA